MRELRVTQFLNFLPHSVVTAASVNYFKSRLDWFWKDCKYTTDQGVLHENSSVNSSFDLKTEDDEDDDHDGGEFFHKL